MRKPMVIAVTGAGGFVGQAVVAHLARRNYCIRAFTRGDPPEGCENSPRCTWLRVDVTDRTALRAATEGVDMLIHLAARKNDEKDSEQVNVEGAHIVAEVCAENGIQRIIHLSTQSSHLKRRGLYGDTKKRADDILRAGTVPVVTLCSSVIYGSAKSGVFAMLTTLSRLPVCPIVGPGTACYWPIHRDDVASIIEQCLLAQQEEVCKHWEMGGPERYTYNQLCSTIAEAQGLNPPLLHLPISLCLMIAVACRMMKNPPITVSNVRGAAESIIMDPQPLLRTVDITPRSLRSSLLSSPESTVAYAEALLRYVLSDCCVSEPTSEEVQRMLQALAVHSLDSKILSPWIWRSQGRLRALDFASRIRYPSCHLQRCLIVAAAIAECTPRSSTSLLPRRFSIVTWLLSVCVPLSVSHERFRECSTGTIVQKHSCSTPMDTDVIVIGSGPAGVHAVLALIECGRSVAMIDGGVQGPALLHEPVSDFLSLRREREDQWRWFLGNDVSAIPVDGLRGGLGGGMTSGNRAFVTRHTEEFNTTQHAIQVIETLAEGGLGAVWGAACAAFSTDTLREMRLPPDDMKREYQEVIDRIGVSGASDEYRVQPPLPVDHHATACLERFRASAAWFRREGYSLLQPLSAVLTAPLGSRRASTLRDTDYYSDEEHAVYRPTETLRELQRSPRFRWLPHFIVDHIRTAKNGGEVRGRKLGTRTVETIAAAKKVILCAGAVGSARILAASKGMKDAIPFIAKPHAYIATIRPSGCLETGPERRMSLCQLVLNDALAPKGPSIAQLYSYRSLLLFRLLGSIPLPIPSAFDIARLFSPGLVIADMRFHSSEPNAYVQWHENGTDISPREDMQQEKQERLVAVRRMRRALRALGLWPVKTLLLPEGSSSHYAGSVPIDGTGPLSATVDGEIAGYPSTYCADASLFPCLPSGPHTLTVMANARRIAHSLTTRMQSESHALQ